MAPDEFESGEHISGAFVVPLHFFGSQSTINRFGERFGDGQYSLVSFLFAVLLLVVPPCPALCKSGGTCPSCDMDSAPLERTKGERGGKGKIKRDRREDG